MRLHETESGVIFIGVPQQKEVTTADGDYVKNMLIKHLNTSRVLVKLFTEDKAHRLS